MAHHRIDDIIRRKRTVLKQGRQHGSGEKSEADGDESDDAEGRNDLLRCAVFYDGRLVDQVIRFDAKGDA